MGASSLVTPRWTERRVFIARLVGGGLCFAWLAAVLVLQPVVPGGPVLVWDRPETVVVTVPASPDARVVAQGGEPLAVVPASVAAEPTMAVASALTEPTALPSGGWDRSVTERPAAATPLAVDASILPPAAVAVPTTRARPTGMPPLSRATGIATQRPAGSVRPALARPAARSRTSQAAEQRARTARFCER
jgi:hypothetical protein